MPGLSTSIVLEDSGAPTAPEQFDAALIKLAGGRLLYADSLGLAEDGSRIMPPVAQTELLTRYPPQGTFDRSNPGVY
jgi:hypothetical protein